MRHLPIVLVLVLVGCSSPGHNVKRGDAVLSGEETAKRASDATREAEEKGETGIIVASSEPAEPEEADSGQSASAPAVLVITMRQGTPTLGGEPIVGVGQVVTSAVEANPDVYVIVERDASTGPRAVEAVIDEAREAGAAHVEERQVLD